MSSVIHMAVPDSLLWCVYRDRVFEEGELILPWIENQSVKDCIESTGIPHTEIQWYSVNGVQVLENSILRPGDIISIRSAGPESFAERVFVLDVHLGKLAVFLRLAGFPAVYSTTCSSDNLIELSHRNGHVLLTRSRGLLKHREVETGLLIQSKDAAEQLKEVIRRFQLLSHVSILSICPKCSKKLNPVSKQHILEQLEPGTIKRYQDFYQCSGCRQIFWKGSHYPAFIRMLDTFRAELLNESS